MRFSAARRAASALLLILSCTAIQSPAQPTLSGKVSGGFQAPSSTDSGGRRHVIKGKDMESRGKDLLALTEPHVTRYNPDDTADMYIDSPDCLYQSKAGIAYSATNLVVRTADSRFAIEGVGWNWDLSGSLLVISNQVVALLEKAALGSKTNSVSNPTNRIRITSQRFQQEGDAASFFGSVLVKDGDDTVRCEQLNIQFLKPGGAQKIEALQNVEIDQGETHIRSGRADYDVKENLIHISEHPTWVANLREGSGDLLLINRLEDTLSATGHVSMKLPLTNLVVTAESLSTNNPATNRFVEISSETFDYQNARSNRLASALYQRNVRATQADATLFCEQLTATFGVSNRLSRLHAVRDVRMVSAKSKVFGREADYEPDADKLTVVGEPRWEMDETKGRSRNLVFFPRNKEMLASEDVQVTLPGHSLGGLFSMSAQTNRVSPTNTTVTVTSQALSRSTNISVFRKDVLVTDERGTIGCDLLTIFHGQTNQTQRIIADQRVVIKQPDLIALGERAEYEQATGIVRLTGDPELFSPDKHLRADLFVIDRNRNTFSVSPGKYRIQMQVSKNQKPNLETK